MHAYSYEHMELAAYELLRRVAERAGDAARSPMSRGASAPTSERWPTASRSDGTPRSTRRCAKDAEATAGEIVTYLRDAHALEAQAIQLLEAGPAIAGFDELATVFREHLEQSREHQRAVDERLEELGGSPGRMQALALRGGALNLGAFFGVQPDTPVKLAGFAYAFEALECGAYELLGRTARRAGDTATAELAGRILAEERVAAERVAATWDAAVDALVRERAGVSG